MASSQVPLQRVTHDCMTWTTWRRPSNQNKLLNLASTLSIHLSGVALNCCITCNCNLNNQVATSVYSTHKEYFQYLQVYFHPDGTTSIAQCLLNIKMITVLPNSVISQLTNTSLYICVMLLLNPRQRIRSSS